MTRVLGWLLLAVAGVLSLPLAAALFDGEGTENAILPAQLGAMAVLGALVGVGMPGVASGSTRRRALVGAALGVLAALAGVVLFFLLLSGFDGA